MKKIIFLLFTVIILGVTVHAEDKETLKEQVKQEHNLIWWGEVRDDVTGNWRLSECATSETVSEYALDYYNAFFESDKEIHGIINFTLKTTTRLTVFDGVISCDTLEYVDGEEHSAKTLFSGDLLMQERIDIETGEVTVLEPSTDIYESEYGAFIISIEPTLNEAFGDNYTLSVEDGFLSIATWSDGFADVATLAKLGYSEAVQSYDSFKTTMQQASKNVTESMRSFVPNGHLALSFLNDQDHDKVLLIYYDGELYYDYVTE